MKAAPHVEQGLNELEAALAHGNTDAETRARKVLDAAGLDADEVAEHMAARDQADEAAEPETPQTKAEARAEAKAEAAEARAAAKAADDAPTGRSNKADKMSTADAPAGEQG